MSTSTMVVIISLAVLVLLYGIFALEERNERRLFLGRLRYWLDRGVLSVNYRLQRLGNHLGAGSVRIWIHYSLHGFLSWCRTLLLRLESYLVKLQRRNRAVAKQIKKHQGSDPHLQSIAEHKAATSLSEGEKRALKDKYLEG